MTDAAPASGKTSSFGFRDVDAAEKVRLVRGVFDSVASNYDLMNDLMSAGVHRLWKDAAAAKLNPRPGEVILDGAGGTGDMARRYSRMARQAQERRGGADASVIVLDYNAEMILAGVNKGGDPGDEKRHHKSDQHKSFIYYHRKNAQCYDGSNDVDHVTELRKHINFDVPHTDVVVQSTDDLHISGNIVDPYFHRQPLRILRRPHQNLPYGYIISRDHR